MESCPKYLTNFMLVNLSLVANRLRETPVSESELVSIAKV